MCLSASGFFYLRNVHSLLKLAVGEHVSHSTLQTVGVQTENRPEIVHEDRDSVDQDRAGFLRSKDDRELSLYDARTTMTTTPRRLRKRGTRGEEKEEKERRNSARRSARGTRGRAWRAVTR